MPCLVNSTLVYMRRYIFLVNVTLLLNEILNVDLNYNCLKIENVKSTIISVVGNTT